MKNLLRYPVPLPKQTKKKYFFLNSYIICLQIDKNFQNLNQNGPNTSTKARHFDGFKITIKSVTLNLSPKTPKKLTKKDTKILNFIIY